MQGRDDGGTMIWKNEKDQKMSVVEGYWSNAMLDACYARIRSHINPSKEKS